MKKYITIVDPVGAELGYGGPAYPIGHRVLFENKAFYGFESIQKLFPSHQSMVDFLVYCAGQTTGACGTFNNVGHELHWSVEVQ